MSDSEDDVPLGQRAIAAAKPAPVLEDSSSEDDVPLAARAPPPSRPSVPNHNNKRPRKKASSSSDDDSSSSDDSGSDSDDSSSSDDVPLAQRRKSSAPPPSAAKKKKPAPSSSSKPPAAKKARKAASSATPRRGGGGGGGGGGGSSGGAAGRGEKKWDTLVHAGVLFPPEYEPHGVKMLYDGRPVELTPEQEEVATMFAVMKDTDYISKPTFIKNFWEGFKEVLGPRHVIQSLDKCDFTPIYDWHMAEREKKKALTKEDKAALKAERDAAEAKYKVALVDGREEQVGNFRVEPPGLFRGRGEHPKMGKVKKRVYPRDITINIGKDAPVPEHPFPGQRWREVRHDNTVTWLAYWRDTVNPKEFKYVWLSANSSFKSESDLLKYEKARKLKDYIEDIRAAYTRDWGAKDARKRQMGVALYFLDKLALRAGHEKDEDEADTVGCCTLKVENVACVPPSQLKFDFLGKDSIKYENTVDVDERVYKAVETFLRVDERGRRKGPRDMLFDTFDATDLNKELKGLMDGLSVKVFRTYNASITLDRLLYESEAASRAHTVDEKKADYDRANKEVAVLCNHQRSVPKTHGAQMDKMAAKLDEMRAAIKALEADLKRAKHGQATADGKKLSEDTVKSRLEAAKKRLAKAELAAAVKEDLKTVALGTSKINYMDPRITIAWCKRNEVPIEKVFNKSLISKFHWAMDADWQFRF